MSPIYQYEHYRGYQIVATGEICQIIRDNECIRYFSREYLCMHVPEEMILALLIDEAQECIDTLLNAS